MKILRPKAFPNADTPLLSLPLSYIKSGWYNFRTGNLSARSIDGDYFTASTVPDSPVRSREYRLVSNSFSPEYGTDKGYGQTLRCVAGTSLTNADTPLLSLPLSYVKAEDYWQDAGMPSGTRAVIFIWHNLAKDSIFAHGSLFGSSAMQIQDNYPMGYGFALRCVARRILQKTLRGILGDFASRV